MLLLNVIPRVAIAARHNPMLGVTALAADGFVSGLVLAPILRIASIYAPGTIKIAMLTTLIVFGTVTLFVMSSNRTFSAPRQPDPRRADAVRRPLQCVRGDAEHSPALESQALSY